MPRRSPRPPAPAPGPYDASASHSEHPSQSQPAALSAAQLACIDRTMSLQVAVADPMQPGLHTFAGFSAQLAQPPQSHPAAVSCSQVMPCAT